MMIQQDSVVSGNHIPEVFWTNGVISREKRELIISAEGMMSRRAVTAGYLSGAAEITAVAENVRFYAACFDRNEKFLRWFGDKKKPYSSLILSDLLPKDAVYIALVAFYVDGRVIKKPNKFAEKISIKWLSDETAGFLPLDHSLRASQLAHDSYMNSIVSSCPDYPPTVAEACRLLGAPLPADACLPNPPSAYINLDSLFSETDAKKIRARLINNGLLVDPSRMPRYRHYLKWYRAHEELPFTPTDAVVWFVDWALFARPRGFGTENYFGFRLYTRAPAERDTFLNGGYLTSLQNLCNTPSYVKYVAGKIRFYRQFPEYVTRHWLDTRTCSFEQFAAFAAQHDRFFAKPVNGERGRGAGSIRTDSDTPENLFAMCKANKNVVEEYIIQHPSLSEFNPTSVNTARVYSLLCADGEARIMMATMRTGRAGRSVDNFHNGGLGVQLDPETGAVITDALDGAYYRYAAHPDSGKSFRGFVYPCWDKVRKAIQDSAKKVPNVRYIGWDIIVKEDETVEFVEANTRPGNMLPQSTDQIGKRPRYDYLVKEIAAQKGVKFPESEPWYLP